MDQQVFNLIGAVLMGLFGIIGFCVAWWVNNIWALVKSQQEQISALNVELAKNYAPRSELQATFERIFNVLGEIQKELRHDK